MNFKEQRAAALKAAQAIIDRAKADGGRDLTDAEIAEVEGHHAEVKRLDGLLAREAKSKELRQAIFGLDDDEVISLSGDGAKSGYLNPRSKSLAGKLASGFHATDQFGQKALVPAGVTIGVTPVVGSTPIELSKPATGLWDLIATTQQATPTYAYLRQTVRTTNAAFVAPGETKPTSTYTTTKVEGRLRVIAHLSEPIDKFMLEDNSNLDTFLSSEMLAGLYDVLAVQVLTGDGAGENLTGIDNTPGIQVQDAKVDGITTLRAALTKLEGVGREPRGFAVNATDWEQMETTRNTSGAFDFGGPIDSATRRAWGVPVAIVPNVPAGSAYLIGEDSVVLRQDGSVRMDWGTPGDNFTRNQITARCETRVNLDVVRPFGIVKITLPD
ncbi:MAG: phage major capsid protein [Aeromicrobium sp.]|uniref:phage major capsid protein n=1 Tax=Aeromicrobium sp. TaxID=1871063 RepID=UPI0039E4DF33